MSNQYFGDDRIVHETPTDISKVLSRRIYSDSEVSDDIVTRLRHQWTGEFDPTGELLCEAADEIECLRAERDEYKRQRENALEAYRFICGRRDELSERNRVLSDMVTYYLCESAKVRRRLWGRRG